MKKSTQKIVIWIIVGLVGFFAVMALVVGLLTLLNSGDKKEDTSNTQTISEVEEVPQPPIDPKAEALKTEANSALAAQKFDEATAKYEEAKAIYDSKNDEMHSSDLQVQIDLAKQTKESYEKTMAPTKKPTLLQTGN